jgi:hypothetical protein
MGGGPCGAKTVPRYRFVGLDVGRHVESESLREAESDDEARKIANNLLIGSRSETIEVWNALKLIYTRSRARSA